MFKVKKDTQCNHNLLRWYKSQHTSPDKYPVGTVQGSGCHKALLCYSGEGGLGEYTEMSRPPHATVGMGKRRITLV